MRHMWTRIAAPVLALGATFGAVPATAKVMVSFYSVQTSMTKLRSVHAFYVMKGTLDADGTKIDENYGFSAKNSSFGLFFHPVKQKMLSETQKYIDKANYHFTVPISDAQYHKMIAETKLWATSPDYKWDIDDRNCVTFVGRMAQMAGLKVDFPKKLMRKPKTYLTHIQDMNSKLLAHKD